MDSLIPQLAVNVGLHNIIGWFLPVYIGFNNILPTLVILYNYADKGIEFENKQAVPDRRNVFDFIIVGGGTAGSVLANRLSENFNVLLLERGGDPNPLTVVPQLEQTLMNRPETDYLYKTVPQNNSCLSLNNQQAVWSRGMSLGGSSVVNSMVYLRGHPLDFDAWSTITGDDRWSYLNVLPFFLKSEDYCLQCDKYISDVAGGGTGTLPEFHAMGGPIGVTQASFAPLVPEFLRATEWAKLPRSDLNAPIIYGSNVVTYTQRNGRRISSYNSYLKPARNRPSLKVVKYAHVYKILFRDGMTNEAFGVEYERMGFKHVAVADKEIILSAGAIDTPKILMLSGIGPRDHLESLQIPVRVEAPVGMNLQDHIGASPGVFLINSTTSYLENRDLNQSTIDQFIFNSTGPFTGSSVHGVAFWPSSRALNTGEALWPDLVIRMSGSGVHTSIDQNYAAQYNVDGNILREYYTPSKGQDGFQMTVYFGRPRSRGYIRLRSRNYMDPPLIDPRYFSDMEGMYMRVMVEGLKRAVYIAENAPSFRALGATLMPTLFPPCETMEFRSDAYWECLIRHYTLTMYHFCGTASMGPHDSPFAVVNSDLRVHGTLRLRVVDASVMPTITSTDTNAATIMIGERAVQLIKSAWAGHPSIPPFRKQRSRFPRFRLRRWLPF